MTSFLDLKRQLYNAKLVAPQARVKNDSNPCYELKQFFNPNAQPSVAVPVPGGLLERVERGSEQDQDGVSLWCIVLETLKYSIVP
jgi:hypothetical protein